MARRRSRTSVELVWTVELVVAGGSLVVVDVAAVATEVAGVDDASDVVVVSIVGVVIVS